MSKINDACQKNALTRLPCAGMVKTMKPKKYMSKRFEMMLVRHLGPMKKDVANKLGISYGHWSKLTSTKKNRRVPLPRYTERRFREILKEALK